MSGSRDLDLVIFGATGLVGQLVATYLTEQAPVTTRIGLAGRSKEKLLVVQSRLGSVGATWPILVADVNDPGSLAEMAAAARVVVNTVGPYRRGGINVVEACVNAGTHYADLSGEVLFIRESIDRFHEAAAGKGIRIVHSCGFHRTLARSCCTKRPLQTGPEIWRTPPSSSKRSKAARAEGPSRPSSCS